MRRRLPPVALVAAVALLLVTGLLLANGLRTSRAPSSSAPPLPPPSGVSEADAQLARTVSPDAPLYENMAQTEREWVASAESYVYMPTEKPRIWVTGKGASSVTVALYPIELRRWLEGNYEYGSNATPVAVTHARLPGTKAESYSSMTVRLPAQKAGAYAAVVQGAEGNSGRQRLLLLVTNVGLVVKTTPHDRLLVQATRLDNGEPLPGCSIEIQQKDKTATGTTDGDGFFDAPLVAGAMPKVLGTRGANVALCFAQDSSDWVKRYPIYFQTDRPVYKPAQTAYFKGVLREDTGTGYRTLPGEKVEVEIQTPDETPLYKNTLTTNEFGSFAGEVALPDGSALGSYPVLVKYKEEETRSELVIAEYRKPEFRATVKPVREVTLVGEKFAVDVEASYYFGAPVAGAQAQYYVYVQPDYLSLSDEGGEDAEDEFSGGEEDGGGEYGGYGEMIAEGTVMTDASGRARITVPTRQERDPMRYVVECALSDASRQEVRAMGGASVLPAAIVVEATPDRYGASPGETVPVTLRTADARTKAPKAASVTVAVERRTWERVVKRDGRVRYKEKIVPVLKTAVKTDAAGKGQFTFLPRKAGDYYIRAVVMDAQKRRMTAENYAWVWSGSDQIREGEYESVQILPDRKRYVPGDTARILVRTSTPDADVWLTIEGRTVQQSRRLKLKGNAQVITLPLPDEYAPGVFVSASYVHNKQLLRQMKMIPVSPKGHLLKVDVASDKETYEPGETARYTVRTTDLSGKPVTSEVALGVVDASIYAIRSDSTPDIRRFFWSARENYVATAYSFASQYAGGPPKEAQTLAMDAERKIRSVFKDTAYWSPAVVTDGNGTATVNVTLPDNLTTWRTTARAVTKDTAVGWVKQEALSRKKLMARLAAPRFLTQGDTLTISGVVHNYTGGPVTANVALAAKGAGIAFAGNAAPTPLALASTQDRRIDWTVRGANPGMTELTLTADAGRAAFDGMTLTIPTLPHGMPKTIASSGTLEKNGITKTFAIPEGRMAFRDDLKVMLAPSLMSAALGSVEELAQYPYGCIEQTLSRFVPNLVLEQFLKQRRTAPTKMAEELPKMAKVGLSRVYEMQNTSGGWAFSSMDRTDVYFTAVAVESLLLAKEAGYEVNERVLARGAVELRRAVAALNTDKPKEPKGGWKERWAKERAERQARRNLHDKARALYVLSLVDPKQNAGAVARLWDRRAELDDVSLAFVTRALKAVGNDALAAQSAAVLKKRAKSDGWGVRWNAGKDWYYLEQDTLATAEAVRALIAHDASDPFIPRAFRYLMAQRRGNGGRMWNSTNDTAAVLYAVTDYERARPANGSGAANGAQVVVNGRTVQTVRFAAADRYKPETTITLDPALLRPGRNTVSVLPLDKSAGREPPYYALSLRYFMPTPPGGVVQPVVAGIRVERTYLKRVPKIKPKVGPRNEGDPYFDYWSGDNWKLVPFQGQAKPGDEIVVKLVATCAQDIGYALIEDPFPAGCEPVDQVDADYGSADEYSEIPSWGRRETHNDRVSYLGERLPRGKTVITYRLRATTPGVFSAPPARAFAMYVPEVRGSAKSARLMINDPVTPGAGQRPAGRMARR